MKLLTTTIAAVLVVGCGEAQPPETPTVKGTDYSGKYTLFLPEIDEDLIFELKPDGSFLGKNSTEAGNDLIGSWKVEGELLICEGTSEKSSQVIIVKFDKKTGKVESMIEGNEIPIKDQIPKGEDGLYFKKD